MGTESQGKPKRGPVAWMAGHPVAANLIMFACLVGGYMALRTMKKEVFPDVEIDAVRISVSYPGASPEEVERGIILAVEEAVRGLDSVDEVSSVAREGSGTVTVDALLGADVEKLGRDIQSEVDRIGTLPEDAEDAVVSVIIQKREVLTLVLFGDVENTTLHELAETVRDELLQDPLITQVEMNGLPPLEISIEISQENLRRYGLTIEEVAARLRSASVELPGGGVKTRGGEILVRMKERRDYGRQFAQLPIIITPDGTEVRLGQIADIRDGFEDSDRYSTYDGKRAVMIAVYRVGNQTPTQVAAAVKRHLEEIRPTLPPGISADISHDMSEIYEQRVGLLLRNGAIGLCLVMVILGLFLEARLAFWVMMGIPISFLGSFLLLPSADVSINMVTLFAYIIVLGIVVDDAIIVGENVYHHRQEGMSFSEAALKGVREVAMPVTFSVLTNIVTFLPLYFIPGPTGRFFKMLPVVVITVFLISLGESLLVLPAHLGHLRERDRKRWGITEWLHAKQQTFSHGFRRWVRRRYGPFLIFTVRRRYLTITTAFAVLILVLAYALSGRLGFGLFPKVESRFAQAKATLPYGSPIEKTEAVMKRLLDGARKVITDCGHPELVTSIVADVGREGSHTGRMRVFMADPEIRDKIMGTDEFTQAWRDAAGEIPGLEHLTFASDIGGPGGRGTALAVELSHREITVLESASADLGATIGTYPRVKDVNDGFQPGKQQLDFTVTPEGKSLGLTAREVARQVRNAFYGAEVLRQQRGRDEIKVMVRLPERERISEYDIEQLMLRTPTGKTVPLREVASAMRGRAYTSINRRNGRRVVQVTADVTPRSKAGEVLADLKRDALPKLVERYHGLKYSFEGQRADIRESMGSLKVTFAMAMLAIYAMLAIPFRSYAQPLIVMVSIPFGIVGAFVGHLIMGYDLSVMSMLGIVALAGVVVNDSLVLIDFANRRRRETDAQPHEVIHDAAIQRFRPVILTTLTTFGGLAPMIFETSRQARFLIPMAISLGFGLLFATLITLVLVPSLYVVTADLTALSERRR